ncbi:leucine-rich repeat domain-containing protein, partial [Leptospira santarosai]|uniref:leucine-rich repeat domain-containing protein n=1 Tax=Leptospira santarosai TaxID=28183 RepID=UPI001F16BB8D
MEYSNFKIFLSALPSFKKKETEMNSNPHFLTKQFRNIGAIFSAILLCFCCNSKAKENGVYYNLTEALQHPTDVRVLNLEPQEGGNSNNQLTTLPKEIENLQNLKILGLGSNQLTTLPKEVGKLQNLEELDLGQNQLTTLPEEIGKLQNLQKLNLNQNQLTTLPKEIGNLQKLQELYLGDNQFATLPKAIG